MKHAIFFLLFSSCFVFGQRSKVSVAKIHYDQSNYLQAKTEIDNAIKDQSTWDDEDTWITRGNIYFAIGISEKEDFKNHKHNVFDEAYESYKKALELIGDKNLKSKQIYSNLEVIGSHMLNEGVAYYNNADYQTAIEKNIIASDISEILKAPDGLAYFNLAMSYDRLNNYNRANANYTKAMNAGYNGESCCLFIISNFKKLGQDENAINMLTDCRIKYPNNNDLLLSELNMFLQSENYSNARLLLSQALANDPNNKVLYFTSGVVHEKLLDLDQAERDYKKALEISPEYLDALYNLGALYYNQSAKIFQKANDITDDELYLTEKNLGLAFMKKAKPHFEKANVLQPNNESVLYALQQIYLSLEELDNFQKIKAQLDKLKN